MKLTQHVRYTSRGKPKADSAIKGIEWQITREIVPDDIRLSDYQTIRLSEKQQQEACFVLGTSIPDTELTDQEVIKGYKCQGNWQANKKMLDFIFRILYTIYHYIRK